MNCQTLEKKLDPASATFALKTVINFPFSSGSKNPNSPSPPTVNTPAPSYD